MYGKSELNHRSNDELARLLYQRDNRAPPVARPQAPRPAPDVALASRRQPYDSADHSWALAVSESSADKPITDRERRALFAALSRGTKANIGREPAVSELVLLVEEVNKARALASSAREAIQGTLSVYIRDGNLIFREPNGHGLEPARMMKGSNVA